MKVKYWTILELTDSETGWPDGPGILSPSPQHWDHKPVCCVQLLSGCWGSKLRSSCLCNKYFNNWVISPELFFFQFLNGDMRFCQVVLAGLTFVIILIHPGSWNYKRSYHIQSPTHSGNSECVLLTFFSSELKVTNTLDFKPILCSPRRSP